MERRSAFTIIILVVTVLAVIFLYRRYKTTATIDQGAVTCDGCMSPERKAIWDRKNSGDTPDGESEHKIRSASADATNNAPEGFPPAAPADQGTQPVVTAQSGQAQTTAYLPATAPTGSKPVPYPPAPPPPSAAPFNPPANDTEPVNPPNGLRFAGQGSFQWYRQGNLTWRINTATGTSCIAYATMEEWSKPIVISHGCGRSA